MGTMSLPTRVMATRDQVGRSRFYNSVEFGPSCAHSLQTRLIPALWCRSTGLQQLMLYDNPAKFSLGRAIGLVVLGCISQFSFLFLMAHRRDQNLFLAVAIVERGRRSDLLRWDNILNVFALRFLFQPAIGAL